MINLVGDQPRKTMFVALNTCFTAESLAFNGDLKRARNQTTYVEKRQAAFMLFIRFGRNESDTRIDQHYGLVSTVTQGRPDNGNGMVEVNLWSGQPHTLAGKVMHLGNAVHGSLKLLDSLPSSLLLGRQHETAGSPGEDGCADLNNAKVAHTLTGKLRGHPVVSSLRALNRHSRR